MACCVCQVRFYHSAAAPRADNVQSPSARAVTITCAGGISSFSRVPCNDLVIKPSWVGRTGEVPCNDSALHRLVEIHQPRARKSLSALGCKCMIRMRRAARSPKLRVCRGGGREKAFCFQFPPLQLQHLQIGTYEELQCCHTIANTPKDLMCLQSAIAEPCLQLQEAPHCNCRGSAAIRVWKCTLQTPRPTREIIVHTSWMQGGA